MRKFISLISRDYFIFFALILLVFLSVTLLKSVSPQIFPEYYTYVFLGFCLYITFLLIGFDVISLFYKHLYIISLLLLFMPLIFGQVTRGAIRWIPVGSLTLQPSEIVRPFLLLFFANFLTMTKINFRIILTSFFLIFIPTALILIQPSLGVALITFVGFIGVVLAAGVNKKFFLLAIVSLILIGPILLLILAPYQKQRLAAFLNPSFDPKGAGYNSIQSVISVGSGKIFGRGLGKGIQTQLSFLPERHTDFVFAAISEELGLVGALLVLLLIFAIFLRLTKILDDAASPAHKAFVAGIYLSLLTQIFIHVGMNLGILPITGVPLPFISAGGSSLIAGMIGISLCVSIKKVTR